MFRLAWCLLLMVRINLQDCHAKCEPEVLLTDDANTVGVPRMSIQVVTIPEHHEDPS